MGGMVGALGEDPRTTVEVTVGHDGFGVGEVTLLLRGAGEIEVRNRWPGGEREWSAPAGSEELRALGAELAALEFEALRARPSGHREPDDAPVRLAVLRDGETVHEARLWHADRWEDARVDGVLRRFEQITAEITDGVMPFGRPSA